MAFKKVEKNLDKLPSGGIIYEETLKSKGTNGDIPVKYEYAELYYDVKEGTFYMHLKVGNKKVTLVEEVE
jgi:hypothetical protein